MIGVTQRFLYPANDKLPACEWGDCFRACIASMLELELDQVPNLHDPEVYSTTEWPRPWREWLWQEYRLKLAFITPPHRLPNGWYGIGSVRVPGADWLHSVVIQGHEIVWDPDPRGGVDFPYGELVEIAVLYSPITEVELVFSAAKQAAA